MSSILKLVQGSPEWHAHRAKSRNASETPTVLGVSPWQTPYQLWLLRTGRSQQKVTPAMYRGNDLEPAARAAYEQKTGNVMEPLVLLDGEYSASFDGMTLAGDVVLEIKCPMKGCDSELWKVVESGEVPEYYGWQIEHQLMVSGAKLAHLWIFDGTLGILREISPNPESWGEIRSAWDRFMEYIESDVAPSLSERDTKTRDDQKWKEAATRYLEAKAQNEQAAAIPEEARAALLALTSHPIESGYGVSVAQYCKRGAIDYKKVPALRGLDLDPYRSPSRIETRVITS